MNDNYLWDKSGEPDEEIQQLESLLREFRYEPRPLVLPEAESERLPKAKAMIFSFVNLRYAAMAAMLLLALGVGLWLSQRANTNAPEVAVETPAPTVTPTVAPPSIPAPEAAPPIPAPQRIKQHPAPAPKAHFAHHAPKRMNKKSFNEEGERAKEKVLYALQLTSEKLNLIAKKIQTDTN
jgi:hypothetical protein